LKIFLFQTITFEPKEQKLFTKNLSPIPAWGTAGGVKTKNPAAPR
jgi:hypothetical protein